MEPMSDAELTYLELTAKHSPDQLGNVASGQLILRLLNQLELAQELKWSDDDVLDLQGEVEELTTKLELAESELQEAKNEIEGLEEEVRQLQDEITILQ
jgi:chromosome segregation ATPase